MTKNPITGNYEYRCAYRFMNGDIEGLLGESASGEAEARSVAIMKIAGASPSVSFPKSSSPAGSSRSLVSAKNGNGPVIPDF